MHVALAARRAELLAEVEQECRVAGPEVLAVATDVGDRGSVDALVHRTLERFGGLDVLVAAAGINVRQRGFAESRPEDWRRIVDVNILGVYHATQAALGPMRERGGG